jgi:hypothetical protein
VLAQRWHRAKVPSLAHAHKVCLSHGTSAHALVSRSALDAARDNAINNALCCLLAASLDLERAVQTLLCAMCSRPPPARGGFVAGHSTCARLHKRSPSPSNTLSLRERSLCLPGHSPCPPALPSIATPASTSLYGCMPSLQTHRLHRRLDRLLQRATLSTLRVELRVQG